MLAGNWSIWQLQIHLVAFTFISDVWALFVSANKEYSICDIFLPGWWSQCCIAQFREIAHVNGDWRIEGSFFLFWQCFQALDSFLADGLFFPFCELEHFPTNFFAVFIVAFQIWANVGNDLCGFVLFDEANNAKDVKDLWDKVLEIEVLLLIHEALNHVLDVALGDCLLLVDEAVKNLR